MNKEGDDVDKQVAEFKSEEVSDVALLEKQGEIQREAESLPLLERREELEFIYY